MGEKAYTKEEVLSIARSLIGKTFGELNSYELKSELYNKGSHGHILEENVFQYGKNNNSIPDFESAGIELKVTPYKINKNGTLAAKERLVLNIINYMEEYKNTFFDSHFWYKNKLIEIVWYLHENGKPKSEFKITDELLFKFPAEDMPIIINDWTKIINKIKAGRAHELSEADTMYLGACTKGANSLSKRRQPFSDEMAMQRAFCLKTGYMTRLVRDYIGKENLERLNIKVTSSKSFEEEIENSLLKYKGRTVRELCAMFNVDTKAKSINEILVARMLGIKGKVANTEQFQKANIIPKTIRINERGLIKESMSFPTFKFEKIVNETWNESDLYEMFSTTKWMFAVFKERRGIYYFDKVKFWNMPLSILDNEIHNVWKKTKKVIMSGTIVKEVKNGKRITNFPGMSDNMYCHVRPHAQNAKDVYPLPVKDVITGATEYTKQCFWLNNKYILNIVGED